MTFHRSDLKPEDDHVEGLTLIAVDGDKNSQCAVKWAMDNLVSRNSSDNCILVHVQCKTVNLGDHLVNSVSKEGRPPTQQELQQFFLPYRGFCARRGIETKEVVLHDHDVPSALIEYITLNNAVNIVVGASHRNALTRKFRHADTPSLLLKSAPESCAVYVIAKGKVQTFRMAKSRPHTPNHTPGHTPSHTPIHTPIHPHSNNTSPANSSANSCVLTIPTNTSSSSNSSNCRTGNRKRNLWEQRRLPKDTLPSVDVSQISFTESWKSDDKTSCSDKSISNSNENLHFGFKGTSPQISPHGRSPALPNGISITVASESSGAPSTDISYENFDFSNVSGHNSSQLATLLDAEMRRLKLELQQSMQLFNSVTKEANFAKQMVKELQRLQTLEARKKECEKATEDATHSIAEMEKQKAMMALEAVRAVQRAAESEAQRKKNFGDHHEANEKPKITVAPAADDLRCRRYTIQEIEIATDHFAPANKIGEGGYGPVYKGTLDHISVAIKILRPDLSQGQKQFRQEIDVLSRIRHPYMVILLGACPEYGCLVYEYMENGSLEDRLFRKGNTPPISWRNRFRIAYEIATALLFLHETKPEPLVHRDLKPANVLLDFNFVSKISDVGLARLLPQSPATNVCSQYRMTAAAGTFYYIDPEYQQTGMLGVKSDLYSFGVVLLQLLTARPPMGLAFQVQDSIDKGTFSDILDKSITSWPVNEALSIAKLGVQCCELRKKDRPDLACVIWPELKKLRDLAMVHDSLEHKTIMSLPSPEDLTSSHSSSNGVSDYFRRMNVLL